MIPTIDADRLWQSIMDIAAIGPTPDGGSCRVALTAEDAAARALFLRWCQTLGLHHEQDAIGNMFLRRSGTDATAPAVAFGSHLDTVPTDGRFDGIAGVLAGLEVLRARGIAFGISLTCDAVLARFGRHRFYLRHANLGGCVGPVYRLLRRTDGSANR